MALTKEQFSELTKNGLSVEQIVAFEKGEKPVKQGYSFDNFTDDIRKGTTSVLSLPADFLNQLAFDVPRQSWDKEYGEGSFEKTFNAGILSPVQDVGGVAGGFIGGGKLNTLIKGGLAATRSTIPFIKKGVQAVTAGAATGAAEGAIRQEKANYSPENVLSGAGMGLLVGGLSIPLAQGAGRAIQKTFSGIPKSIGDIPSTISDIASGKGVSIRQKLSPEQRIQTIKSTNRRIGKEQSIIDREETLNIAKERDAKVLDINQRKEYLRKKAVSLGRNRAEKTALYQQGLKKLRDEAKLEIGTVSQKLDNELDLAISGSVSDIQTSLPKLYREASSSFGARMGTIDDKTILRPSQVREFFTDIMNDSSVKGGATYDALKRKAEKYGMRIIESDRTTGFEGLGKPVSIRELMADISDIGNSLSSSVKSGERFTGADVPYAVMQDKLSSFVPELRELRSAYRPILLAMKQSARVFKPGLGDAGTRGAELFLKRMASGKASNQDKWLMDMISKPSEFTTGIGGVTQKVSFLGKSKTDNIVRLQKLVESRKDALKNKYNQQIASSADDKVKVQQNLIDLGVELRLANEQAKIAKQAIEMGDIKSSKEWAERLASLSKTEEKLMKIRNAQKKASDIKKVIGALAGVGAVAVGATAGARYAVGRGASASQTLEQVVGE